MMPPETPSPSLHDERVNRAANTQGLAAGVTGTGTVLYAGDLTEFLMDIAPLPESAVPVISGALAFFLPYFIMRFIRRMES